ncbi:LacI family DNA-binding transcriptional regulator [Streptomyces pseudovenezuelae]|uniref:DNA-binding LacI/PurR family transcriptional regulator n=1 Tax=Streptomyces pseudovenezuelae TaxID=67350 RepID=A0ABT6LX12_9ACTN|nr:LacI family DNA-binding transcriptional regulator [Streptomyces pseudovenezuelae]MDH6220812.1 DNA-binding LacI/PurR family transcriptional regulator [Streptomyces pseudovenezuelae]
MGGSGRVTLNDVAKASGVSRATVSFVLNDDPRQTISGATRERVLAAAHELGYVPHGIARALREGSSRIVVLNVDEGLEGNFSRSYVRGLDEELADHDHVLLVRHGHTAPEATQKILDAIVPRAVLRLGEVYMRGHGPIEEDWENGFAANAAVQVGHLAERGHSRITVAMPDHDFPLTEARLGFAREAARRLGLPPLEHLVVPRPREAGAVAVEAFRAAHPDVTAVAAFDDDIALRTLTALHDLGLRVPEDMAVIGFDETEHGSLTTPALTTVRIDAEVLGRLAARDALGIDTEGLAPEPGRIVVRDSV